MIKKARRGDDDLNDEVDAMDVDRAKAGSREEAGANNSSQGGPIIMKTGRGRPMKLDPGLFMMKLDPGLFIMKLDPSL